MLRNKGFTLVESIIAICLVVLAIVSMTSSFVATRMHVTGARHHYRAASIARDKLEELMQAGISEGDSSTETEGASVIIDSVSGLTGTRSTIYSPDPAGDSVTVTVKISWTETMGGTLEQEEVFVLFLNTI